MDGWLIYCHGHPVGTTRGGCDEEKGGDRDIERTLSCEDFPLTNMSIGFPDRRCPNDLRAQVRFPSCWCVDLSTCLRLLHNASSTFIEIDPSLT